MDLSPNEQKQLSVNQLRSLAKIDEMQEYLLTDIHLLSVNIMCNSKWLDVCKTHAELSMMSLRRAIIKTGELAINLDPHKKGRPTTDV